MEMPITYILETRNNLEKFHKDRANAESRVHVQGWASLLRSSWMHGKDCEITPVDLLPYPEQIKTGSGRINPRTLRVLLRLIKENRLPNHVIDAATDNEEVRTIVDREKLWRVTEEN